MSQVIHQVRYGWSPSSLLGTRGMGPVESTLPADLLTVWDGYLRDHVLGGERRAGVHVHRQGGHRGAAAEGRDPGSRRASRVGRTRAARFAADRAGRARAHRVGRLGRPGPQRAALVSA